MLDFIVMQMSKVNREKGYWTLPFSPRPVSSLQKLTNTSYIKLTRDFLGSISGFQSAYKSHHSTETALVKVHNEAIGNSRSVILLLLDLSAALDTVDHSIFLSRLQNRFVLGNCS